MLGKVAPGDVVTVTRIDRLARRTFDLFGIASASSTPITIKITCRKPGSGRPTKPWPLPDDGHHHHTHRMDCYGQRDQRETPTPVYNLQEIYPLTRRVTGLSDEKGPACELTTVPGPAVAKRMNASRYLLVMISLAEPHPHLLCEPKEQLSSSGQKGVKVGGFRVPTQDVSGVLGSVRNDAMTVWAQGDEGATT